MKATGITRPVDHLGRICLPMELRREYGIREGNRVDIFVDNGTIILKKCEISCVFCGSQEGAEWFKGKMVCEGCRENLKGELYD